MAWGWALLGAFVLTYIVSRIGRRIAGSSVARLVGVHAASYLLLAALSGFVRGGMNLFETRGLVVYLLPQLLWLALDLARRPIGAGR